MKYEINLNNKKYIIEVGDRKALILKKTEGPNDVSVQEDYVDVPDFDFSEETNCVDDNIKSPIFGTVISVNVKAGDEVKKGEILLVLESMKMENEIIAQVDCIVEQVLVQNGSFVEKNQVLLFVQKK